MAKRKTTRTATKELKPKTAVQEALEVTWLLKGNLKNVQIAYIRVGKLLAQVREKRLYAELKHPDIESYAQERLQLGRASLYRYLQVHDWLVECHPEWLEPKPAGFIPDLADALDLAWIEKELHRTDLKPATRTALQALQQKALQGGLRSGELEAVRRKQPTGVKGLRAYLSKLRLLRGRAAELVTMPPEVLTHLDAAIGILKNESDAQAAETRKKPSGG